MRRRLATAAVVCAVVAILAALGLLTLGTQGVVGNTGLWVLVLVVAILALVGAVLTGVFAIVSPSFGVNVPLAELQQAAAEGRDGFARVVSARPTGSRINNSWVYDADLVVDGTAAPTYRTQDRVRVPGPRVVARTVMLEPGAIVAVVRPRADSPQVVVTAGPDAVPQDTIVPTDAPGWPG
jgi:hypothetical protein